MRKLYTITLLLLQFIFVKSAFSQASGIYITEIMASNDFTLEDANFKSRDWIEIYNNTNASVDLANYYMSDDKLLPTKFRFANVVGQNIIPAFSYKIIWASGRTISGYDHTNFTLSASGEHLSLVAPDGVSIMDSLTFPAQYADVSYGRTVNNFSIFRYFSPASPEIINNDTHAFIDKLKKPQYDISGGYYDSNPLVTISNPNVSSIIKYSIDKSDIGATGNLTFNYQNFYPQNTGDAISPLQSRILNNFLYTMPIQLADPSLNTVRTSNYNFTNFAYPFIPSGVFPKANVIRARAFKPNYIPSDMATNTYFKTPNAYSQHNLETISLTCSDQNLVAFNTGIATAGLNYINSFLAYGNSPASGNFMQKGKAWERNAHLELFNDSLSILNKEIGIRIHGNQSRLYAKKSFRLYLKQDIDLFGDTSYVDTYTLKNPGSLPKNHIGHAIMKNVATDIQKIKPLTMYMNGEYFGQYTLMNHLNEEYLANKYQIDELKLDIIKGGIAENGNDVNYNQMMNYINNFNPMQVAVYDSIKAYIDTENLIDYFANQIIVNNTDWPVYNTFAWRLQSAQDHNQKQSPKDGRWRWIIDDMDDTFTNPSVNNFANARYGSTTGNIFNRLLLIADFKNQFINRMADICNSSFAYTYTSDIYQKIYNEYLPDLSLDLNRWGNGSNYSSWLFNMGQINLFLQQRVLHQRNHLINEFGITGTYQLTVLADTNKGNVKVNSILINSNTPGIGLVANNWSGTYFDNIPLNIEAVPLKGYRFTHWLYNGQVLTDSILILNTNANQSYTAFFERILLSANPSPVAYQLINCKYKMSHWNANASSGTFPAHMRLVYMQNVDPGLNSVIGGNVNGVYNFASKTRINGLNSRGIAFINTNSSIPNLGYPNGRLGGAILALNTVGIDTVKISFKARTIQSNTRKYAIRLQYRVGDIIDFEDFDIPINYQSSTIANDSMVFAHILLPDSLLNKPYVQLLWRYYYTGVGNSGSRDQLAIDDIIIDAIKVQSNASSLLGNPSYTHLGLLNTDSILQISSSNAILFKPGFELSNGQVFEAKMQTCPEN